MAILEIFNLLHFVGLAFGVGGATVASIISAKAEKNQELSPAVMKIIPSISRLIWLGLILLIISGIGLSYNAKWPINTKILTIKHALVALIIIIGAVIGFKVKKMSNLAPKLKQVPSLQFIKTKNQLKVLSTINLILWYIVVILSVFI